MINIMKNVSKILLKRKSFVLTSFLMPLVLVLFFGVLYGSVSTYKVGIINNDSGKFGKAIEERLADTDIIEVIELEDGKDYSEDLMFHKFEMVIIIDENFTEKILDGDLSQINIKSISQTDMEPTVMGILEGEVKALATISNNIPVEEVGIDKILTTFNETKPNYEVNITEDNKVGIAGTMGIIFYVIFIAASMSSGFLLEDEREGTKDRVLMGKVSEKEYYGGLCSVLFILTSIPAIEYFIICNVLDYEFGFENKILLLVLLLLFVAFTVVFTVLVASLVKKKSVFGLVNTAFTLPMFMLSGSFWPFEMMSDGMQKVGSILPPRWIYLGIEKLQAGGGFQSILIIIGAFVMLIIFLFLLSIYFTRNKIVLVEDTN